MDPVLLAKIGRALLNTAGTALVTKGILSAAQESVAETAVISLVGAIPLLYSVGMVIYRHYRPTTASVIQTVSVATPVQKEAARVAS